MKVQQVNPAKLVPADYNPRTISEHQAAALKRSIDRWGFVEPVVANKRTGRIVGGHQRIDAALALAVATVPVHWIDVDEASEKALNIALNKISGQWDEDLLGRLLSELEQGGQDLEDLGFDPDELQALIDETAPALEMLGDLDDIPEAPIEPTTKAGDVWQLGPHRLVCGDSTNPEHVAKLMDGKKADLIHADPPYGMGKESSGVANDNLYREQLDKFQMQWWQAFRPHTIDTGSAYIWGNAPDLWRLWYAGGLADSETLTVRNEIVWDKKAIPGMKSPLLTQYAEASERCLFFQFGEQFDVNINAEDFPEQWEPIRSYLAGEVKAAKFKTKDVHEITGVQMASHWFTKSQFTLITEEHYEALKAKAPKCFGKPWRDLNAEWLKVKQAGPELRAKRHAEMRSYFDNAHESMRDVWEYSKVQGNDRHGHATPKPVEMVKRVLVSSCKPGGLVVEPFAGSGSTLIAAEASGRICYTMELEPEWCDVTIARWEQATGRKAERV